MTAAVPLVERLAEGAFRHALDVELDECECGWVPDGCDDRPTRDQWSDHIARALLPVVEQAVAEARGEALRAAGQDYLAQHAGSGHRRPVDVRRWLFARADAIATTEEAP